MNGRRMLGILMGLTFLAMLVPPLSAASAACSEKNIFVRSTSSAGNTNGTRSLLTWFDRDRDPDCGNPPAIAGSTAFMSKGDAGTDDFGIWIEVGWRHYPGCDGPTSWCWFTEKGHQFTAFQINEYGISAPTPGTQDGYRITNEPTNPNGSTDWKMQVDAEPNGLFGTLDTYNTLWHTGVAMGETVAIGNETGMRDEQRSLKFKNDNGDWNPWPNVDCRVDTSANWDWDRVSDSAYDVVRAGQAC